MNTLELMLEAERRDNSWVQILAEEDHNPFEEFGINCNTVVTCVTTSIDFDQQCRGEIDPIDQIHYLAGPNALTEQDLKAMGWESRTEAANR